MAGISRYFHGECGKVTDRRWFIGDLGIRFAIQLMDDPHAEWAYSGTDIGFDLAIGIGDLVRYVRLNTYFGIWVREGEERYPTLAAARTRASGMRLRCMELNGTLNELDLYLRYLPDAAATRLRYLIFRPLLPIFGLAITDRVDLGEPPDPALRGVSETFFLSCCSRDILIAYLLYRELMRNSGANVWFYRSGSVEAPEHEAEIDDWLRSSVGQSQGFVLLLTRAALGSAYVAKELSWAVERARSDPLFTLIVLKLEDVPVPAVVDSVKSPVVDCSGMTWGAAVTEELFARLHRRESRKDWIEDHRRRGYPVSESDERYFGAGIRSLGAPPYVAIRLEYTFDRSGLNWSLEAESETAEAVILGTEQSDDIVDLGIKPGDMIRCYLIYDWRDYLMGIPAKIWMRDVSGLTPEMVLEAYSEALLRPPHDERRVSAG